MCSKEKTVTHPYVLKLVAAYPEVTEIWLIGSRAGGTAGIASDWDYLVFANQKVLRSLRQRKWFNSPEIDLLVVHDGNRFAKPWSDGPRTKAGSLADWDWQRTSSSEGNLSCNEISR